MDLGLISPAGVAFREVVVKLHVSRREKREKGRSAKPSEVMAAPMEWEPGARKLPSGMRTKQANKGNKICADKKITDASKGVAEALTHSEQSSSVELGDEVAARLVELVPTEETIARGQRCLEALQSVMVRLGLDWEVKPFGSFANGFCTVSSDLDVTCCQADGQTKLPAADAQQQAAFALGGWIVPMLQLHGAFSVVEEILGARVPILKLRFEQVLDVDLSWNNPKPLLNTRLLKTYSQMHPLVKDLGITVKLWAKAAGICDATNSSLSSYSFTLLVLYFLQVHRDVQLPVLPVEAFEDERQEQPDERLVSAMAIWHRWQCNLSLPDMMLRFFAFYSSHGEDAFQWGTEVVSVRCGSRLKADEPIFMKLRGRQACRLHIEDPYEVDRNLHGVLGGVEEAQLRIAFSDAWQDMQLNRLPKALLQIPKTEIPVGNKSPGKDDLLELVRVYKSLATESSGVSTNSGGAESTDDGSCPENLGKPTPAAIPLPAGLLGSGFRLRL